MSDEHLPEWLGRELLQLAADELELPWDAAALVCGPDAASMSHDDQLEAVRWSHDLVDGMRRRLPRGMSSAVVGRHWGRLAHQLAAWAIVRRSGPDRDDDRDDPAIPAAMDRGPVPRGPRPGGGAAAVEVVERKGGRRVPR